jgi:hypothetical protein
MSRLFPNPYIQRQSDRFDDCLRQGRLKDFLLITQIFQLTIRWFSKKTLSLQPILYTFFKNVYEAD